MTAAEAAGFVAFTAPLMITSAKEEPLITSAGAGLFAVLCYATMSTPSKPISEKVEAKNLENALKSVVATSNGNLATRVALSAVHFLAANQMAARAPDFKELYWSLNVVGIVLLSMMSVI